MYIWELPAWPRFTWRAAELIEPLAQTRHLQGRLIGRMEGLGFRLKAEAQLRTLTEEVVKTSEIEGEILDGDQVRSSIARRLGLDAAGLVPSDRRVDGVVDMMLDATQQADMPLSKARLFRWHRMLFRHEAESPRGHIRNSGLRIGGWRTDANGPMQVVSGPIGRERVHYEAPPAARVAAEMAAFLSWFNEDMPGLEPVLKAALAHLHFVTIHPFDDGNGRIARALADMLLARSEKSGQRFYSLSSQIRAERKAYYDMLERTQRVAPDRVELDVTHWLGWFIDCLGHAVADADRRLSGIMRKARFWERFSRLALNDRQRSMVNRLLDGFEGKMTTSKWAKLAKCSQDTAHRDIIDLIEKNLLRRNPGGGRNTSYDLNLDETGG